MLRSDQDFMQEAIRQARLAAQQDEVPVGVVITHHDTIIARAHNQVEMLKDPTAHAEMIAITQAASALGHKWLKGCCLYVTVEPCSMCAGAMVLARLSRLCFGAVDPKTGACGSVIDIVRNKRLNHQIDVCAGVEAETCGQLLTAFFQKKRDAATGRRSVAQTPGVDLG